MLDSKRPPFTSRLPIGLALAAVLLAAHGLAYVLWTEDDAGVSLRYVANLVDGHGLVYNPGERVEAISNLGYVLLLTPVAALGRLDPVQLLLAAKLIGLLAAVLGLLEAHRLAGLLGLTNGVRVATACLIAGSTGYAAWAVGALEVPFVAWATTALVAAAVELAATTDGRRAGWRAVAAAVALTVLRVDGFVAPVIVATLLLVLPHCRRRGLAVGLAAATTLLAIIGFRLAYYGHAFPSPVHAKVDLHSSVAVARGTLIHYVRPFLNLHGSWPLALAAVATAVAGALRPVRGTRMVSGVIVGLIGYNLVIGKDWMPLHRFLVPIAPALIALEVAVVVAFLRKLAWQPSRVIQIAVVSGAIAVLALAGHRSFRERRAAPLFYLHPTAEVRELIRFWAPAVAWLSTNIPEDGVLLTSEAGFIPFLSGLRTVESYGLATPAIANLPRDAVDRSTLGVLTTFIAGPPANPAQDFVARVPADALVLQERMVRGWNGGALPNRLFAGRYRQVDGSPTGGWAIYRPALALSE